MYTFEKFSEFISNVVIPLCILIIWLMGIVLAQGWTKVAAIFFPPYSFYLVVEHFMKKFGMIQ